MGYRHTVNCTQCNYETVVSGGDDGGMRCTTTTISCQECRELFDVVTSRQPWDGSAGLSDEELVCPRSARAEADGDEDTVGSSPRHVVRRWKFPGPCPKCGEAMTQGRTDGPYTAVLWD